ncbi:unnamed protein product [Prunus armeniaca]|uniref:Uncharacterized protein n=1 Tax=Prunus armeniaca TaxID=36596 RepID=A0A6J5TIM6_PRUAR|nr:unnamed protein product [Prunus armeniaca]
MGIINIRNASRLFAFSIIRGIVRMVVSGINRGSSSVYKGFLSYFKRVLFIKALRLVGWLHCVFFNWVVPYGTGCKIPLSNFEGGQEYRVCDTSVDILYKFC